MNINLAIINTETVIACGSSIDIYPLFDTNQVIICPYIIIEKENIQMIYMNISFDDNNQLKIYSNPAFTYPPKYSIKFNNTLITPKILNRTLTYYLSFSSQLICRYSWLLKNETICFYYPNTTNFLHIEYHYDEIKHGSLILSDKSRFHYYIIFMIIIILILIISLFAIYILCTNHHSIHNLTQLDFIIERQMARQEAVKKTTDPLPTHNDGHIVQQPILNEHLTTKDSNPFTGDI